MNKASLLLPSFFLVLGIAAGHYFPSSAIPKKIPAAGPPPDKDATAPAAPSLATLARPAQPFLADWHDFLQTLERATLTDLPALWDVLPFPERNPPPGPGFSPRHRMLIERWTELDPPGALAFIQEKAPSEDSLFLVVFQIWAQLDPEAALTALQVETNPKIRNPGIAGFLLAFRENPAQLVQWGKRFTWADASKLSANNFAKACPDDLLLRLLAADRTGLQEIALHLPSWFQQRLETLTFIEQARTDLPATIASLKTRGLAKEQASAFAENLGSLVKSHPAHAIDILDALSAASGNDLLLSGEAGRKMGADLVKYLASSNPADAATFITKHLDLNIQYDVCAKTYPDLFASNPASALIVAKALPPFPTEFTEVPSFKDRQSALDILPSAPPSWRRDRVLQTTLDQWHRGSPAAAQAWMEALPPGEFRERAAVIMAGQALNQNIISLQLQEITLRTQTEFTPAELKGIESSTNMAAMSDPQGTLALLANWPSGAARQTALEKAGSVAASRSTATALDWAQQIPDPSAQADAIRGVLGVWTAHEPLAASGWLPTLAPGPVREAAVDRFAETIATLDPAASLAWATTLSDPAARATRLETTYRKWATDDPAAASAGLTEIPGLGADDLHQLRTAPNPPAQ